ncbi:hypothetical protein CL634_03770 [bacterium]|nr:hypothetical protein [bacterium]
MLKITGTKINKKLIDKKVLNSKTYGRKAFERVNNRVKRAQDQFRKDFEGHPITSEIDAGPNAENTSNTLSGYGNLYSFIGFMEGSNPLSAARKLVNSKIKIHASRKHNFIEYSISAPSLDDFESTTRMPYEAGNSWMRMLELGMTSFSFYMFKKWKSSRSGKGIQINNMLRGASSKPTPYITEILRNFRKRLLQ